MKKKLSKLTLRKIDVEQSDILSKKDLKHIMGGYDGGGSGHFYCVHDSSSGVAQSGCWMDLKTAIAYCQAWDAMGFACKCISC